MSPQQHPDGEGPANPDEARGRMKDWWDSDKHGKKAKDDKGRDHDENSRNDDLGDTSKGGKANWDF